MADSDVRLIEIVDQLCDQFESRWNGECPPDLAEYLRAVDEALRPSLLGELLLIEWELRVSVGDVPRLAEYLARFSEFAEVVRRAYGRHIEWLEQSRRDEQERKMQSPALPFPVPRASSVPTESESPLIGAVPPAPPTLPNSSAPVEWPTFGKYPTRGLLGAGAMGVVYLGHDPKMGRDVAIKVPRRHLIQDRDVVERLRREAIAAGNLHHRNICPVYDVGDQGETPFLVMKRIVGQTLAEVLKQHGPLTPERCAQITLKLARALREAHELGILHRDLKPANVMIDSSGEPMIMDFGLARLVNWTDSNLTMSGVFIGSPVYMAPEQILGQKDEVGPACDLYGLGVLLFEMLTGEVPYTGTALEVIAKVRKEKPRSLRKLRPDIDARLAAICDRLMARNPADRYPNAAAVAEALERWCAVPSVPVGPLPTVPSGSAPKGPRTFAWIAGGVALTGVVLVTLSFSLSNLGTIVPSPMKHPPSDEGKNSVAPSTTGPVTELAADRAAERAADASASAASEGSQQDHLRREVDRVARGETNDEHMRWLRDSLLDHRRRHVGRPESMDATRLLARLPSWADAWDARTIPEYEARIAAGGNAASLDPRVVRVWGDSRWKQGNPIHHLAPHPTSHLLAAADDFGISIWNLRDGELQRRMETGSLADFLGWHPDGERLTAVLAGQEIVTWSATTGEIVSQWGHPVKISALRIGPEGERLVLGDVQGRVQVGTTEPTWTRHADSQAITALALSPDSTQLATVGTERWVRVWDMANGERRAEWLAELSEPMWLDFLDAERVVVGSGDGSIELRRVTSGELLQRLDARTEGDFMRPTYALDRFRRRLFTRVSHSVIDEWDAENMAHLRSFPVLLSDHRVGAPMALTSDGLRLVMEQHTGSLAVVELLTGELQKTEPGGTGWLKGAVRHDGRLVAVVNGQHPIDLWNLETGEYTPLMPTRWEADVVFVPRKSQLYSTGGNWVLRRWNTGSGAHDALPTRFVDWIWSVDVSADERWLAMGGWRGNLELWDHATFKLLHRWLGHTGRCEDMALNPRGDLLVTVGADRFVRYWRVPDCELLYEARLDAVPRSLDLDPLGERVAVTAGASATVLDARGQVLKQWQGRLKPASARNGEGLELARFTALRFSPDGERLVGTDEAGRILIFDARGHELLDQIELARHVAIHLIGFLPGGRHAITASSNGTVQAIRLSSRD